MAKNLFLIIFLLILGSNLWGQRFTATVSQNTVYAGKRFELKFSLNAEGSNFKAPDLSNFRILSGPNQSTSMSIINGRMSREISFSYILEATKEGQFTIEPASIRIDGNTVKSNPITIEVLPKTEAQKRAEQQQAQEERTMEEQAKRIISENLFVKVLISKQSVYQGEQFVATYKLYQHPDLRVTNIRVNNIPSFEGFWTQEISTSSDVEWEVLNGIRYATRTIKKVILIPQRTGNLPIEPYSFDITAQFEVTGGNRGSRDPFESFFRRRNVKEFSHTVKSPDKTIKVKSFPGEAPNGFVGAVGDLSMEAWFDNTIAATGQPLSLKVKISGEGNLKLIDPLAITLPPGFEMFDPKTADNSSVTASGVRGDITFEYIMIPKTPGTFEFGPVKFAYFDLRNESFKQMESEQFELQISKGDGDGNVALVQGVNKEDIELLGKDIRFIKTDFKLSKKESQYFLSPLFFVLNLLPIAGFFVFLLVRKKQEQDNQNVAFVRNKKAARIAKKRLKKAEGLVKSNSRVEFYEEIDRTIWLYLSDKLNIQYSELNKDKAQESLEKYNVDVDLINNLFTIIDQCEIERYSPQENQSSLKEIYQNASNVLIELEGSLK